MTLTPSAMAAAAQYAGPACKRTALGGHLDNTAEPGRCIYCGSWLMSDRERAVAHAIAELRAGRPAAQVHRFLIAIEKHLRALTRPTATRPRATTPTPQHPHHAAPEASR